VSKGKIKPKDRAKGLKKPRIKLIRPVRVSGVVDHELTALFNPHVAHDDPVAHPAHYTSGKIEVLDFIEDQGFDYHIGQVVKYCSRAGKKDAEKTVEDYRKAEFYLRRKIRLLEEQR